MGLPKSNFTMIPNALIEDATLSNYAFRVAIFLCRKTWGWRKETDAVSLSQIVEGTGIHRSSVQVAIKDLVVAGYIEVESHGTTGGRASRYTMLVDDTLPPSGNPLPPSGNLLAETLPPSGNTKESIKETIQKKNTDAPPQADGAGDVVSSKPKRKREIHPCTKATLDAWADVWKDKYGTPYPWNAGTKAVDARAGYFATSSIASTFCAEVERQVVTADQVARGMRWWIFDSYAGYPRTFPAFARGCWTTQGCREAMGAADNKAAEESFEEFAARMNRR